MKRRSLFILIAVVIVIVLIIVIAMVIRNRNYSNNEMDSSEAYTLTREFITSESETEETTIIESVSQTPDINVTIAPTTQNTTKNTTQSTTKNTTQSTTKSTTSAPNQSSSNSSYVEQVIQMVNQERGKAGVSALTTTTNLSSAAATRAQEIVGSFSHTRPSGAAFNTVLNESGISYSGAGENIAWGQTTPQQVMESWMNSSGHKANILNGSFTKIGVGFYKDASGKCYWTQEFIY